MSNQSLKQQTVRSFTGTTSTYEGDWHALFDAQDIQPGDFNGRLLAWINDTMDATFTNLPSAQAAFAIENGAPSWNELGTWIEG